MFGHRPHTRSLPFLTHTLTPHAPPDQAWWPARLAVARMLAVDALRRVGAREEGPWRYALGGGLARDALEAAWTGPWGLRPLLRTLRARVATAFARAERRARRIAAEAKEEAQKEAKQRRAATAAHATGAEGAAPPTPSSPLSNSDTDLFLISLLAVSIGVIVMIRAARRRQRQERRFAAAVAAVRGRL